MSVLFGADEGPGRFAVFLVDTDTGGPATNIPVFATAVLGIEPAGDSAPATQQRQQQTTEIALGVLASDHTGYVSWDLEPLRRQAEILGENATGASLSSQIDNIFLHLYGPLQSVVDALPSAQVGPEAIVLRLAVDRNGVYAADAGSYPSMQSPTLVDLNLSPGSFANVPAVLVGQDGCEALLPSNVATQHFQLHQIVQLPSAFNVNIGSAVQPPTSKTIKSPTALEIAPVAALAATRIEFQPLAFAGNTPLALVVDYDVTWIPVGHGLGQIAYSLPLAPGEQVNVAMLDWARQSTDSRNEETMLTDTLDHSQVRDRTVDEVVSATVHEFQAGGSLLGGLAAAVSTAYGSAVGSIGGGYSTTQGDRDVSSQTVQSLQDSFAQHSTAIRDLRSTVVVQSTQSEQSSAQTRTVRNHNHAHALTLLYYEVLRHFRVVVERADVTAAVLIPGDMPDFDEETIYTYRRFLEPGLIDASLDAGFDAVEKFFAWGHIPMVTPFDPGAAVFDTFTITLQVGGVSSPGGGSVRGKVGLADGTEVDLIRQDDASDADTTLQADGDLTQPNQANILTAKLVQGRSWRDMRYFLLNIQLGVWSPSDQIQIIFDSAAVVGQDTTGGGETMVLAQVGSSGLRAPHTAGWTFHWMMFVPPAPPPPPVPTPASKLTDDENLLRVRLKWHLDHNKAYYYRLIWLGEDPNSRYQRLRNSTVTVGGQTRPIFEAVTNRALDVLGDSTAFALDPGLIDAATASNLHGSMPALPVVGPARDERVVSLPTRGIFAEAKLGHCNAAEVIDNTRFWDWQTSPDPDSAPPITDISLASRDVQTSTTPTPFPASLVNIVSPPQAPDPVAMAGALGLLGKSDIFRDMSTSTQVAGLLQSLAGDATSLAKSGSGTAATTAGAASSGAKTTPSGSSAAAPSAATTGSSASSPSTAAVGASTGGSPTSATGTTTNSDATGTATPSGSSSVVPAPVQPVAPLPPPAPPAPITSANRTLIFNFFQLDASELAGLDGATSAVGRFTVSLQQGGNAVGELSGNLGPSPFILTANVDPSAALHVVVSGDVTILGTQENLSQSLSDSPPLPIKICPYSGQNDFTLAMGVKQYLFQISRTSATGNETISRATINQSSSTVKELVSLALGSSVEVASVNGSYGTEDSKTLLSGTTDTTSVTVPYVAYTGALVITSDPSVAKG